MKEYTEIIEKWKPTGLLHKVCDRNGDMLLISMMLEWLVSRLVIEHTELDEQLMSWALPVAVRLYHKDREISKTVSFPILWSTMKNVFNDLDISASLPDGSVLPESINVEVFTQRVYKKLDNQKIDVKEE